MKKLVYTIAALGLLGSTSSFAGSRITTSCEWTRDGRARDLTCTTTQSEAPQARMIYMEKRPTSPNHCGAGYVYTAANGCEPGKP